MQISLRYSIGSVPSLPHLVSTSPVISGIRIVHSATQDLRRHAMITNLVLFSLIPFLISKKEEIACRMAITLVEISIGGTVRLVDIA